MAGFGPVESIEQLSIAFAFCWSGHFFGGVDIRGGKFQRGPQGKVGELKIIENGPVPKYLQNIKMFKNIYVKTKNRIKYPFARPCSHWLRSIA